MPSVGQIADQQAPVSTRWRAGEQIPLAGLLPRTLRIDGLIGGLRVDGDPIGGIGEYEQFGTLVAVEIVRYGVDGHLVDRDFAVGPVRGQGEFVGSLGIGRVGAGAVRSREPAI